MGALGRGRTARFFRRPARSQAHLAASYSAWERPTNTKSELARGGHHDTESQSSTSARFTSRHARTLRLLEEQLADCPQQRWQQRWWGHLVQSRALRGGRVRDVHL